MLLVPNNSSGQTMTNGGIAPYCPAGAVTVRYDNTRAGNPPNTYALRRDDWPQTRHNDHKLTIAGKLYARIARQMHRTYATYTIHNCDTGQLVSVNQPLPFGTPNPLEMQRTRELHEFKLRTRAYRASLCGKIIAAIESDPDDKEAWAESFAQLVHETSGASIGRFITLVERLTDESVESCERSGCGHLGFVLSEVRVGQRLTQQWCHTCVDERSQYIERLDEHVDEDQVVSVNNDSFYEALWYAEVHYYRDRDGDWYTERQSNDDEDDDEDRDSPELHGYHTTKRMLRGWTMAPDGQPTITTGCWAPMTIGIELEVETKHGYDRCDTVAPLVYALRNTIGAQSVFAERDGSLDADKGFELIFGWSDLPSWQRAMPRVGAKLKDGDVISHDAGNSYGLHVNVAVTKNLVVQAAITWFINNNANSALLFALARREATSFCPRASGLYYPTDSHNAAVNFGNTAGQFMPDASGKAIDCDSTIASFRLFRGTTSPVRLMACIEFCHSLVSAATAYSYQFAGAGTYPDLSEDMFKGFGLRYWQTHVLKNITRYPTLVNYLRGWDTKYVRNTVRKHGAFSDYALTRFVSRHPMGAWTGATHDGLDKRALAVLTTNLQSVEE